MLAPLTLVVLLATRGDTTSLQGAINLAVSRALQSPQSRAAAESARVVNIDVQSFVISLRQLGPVTANLSTMGEVAPQRSIVRTKESSWGCDGPSGAACHPVGNGELLIYAVGLKRSEGVLDLQFIVESSMWAESRAKQVAIANAYEAHIAVRGEAYSLTDVRRIPIPSVNVFPGAVLSVRRDSTRDH